MRTKHIVLPIVALILLSTYGVYNQIQKAKFNPTVWKSDVSDDSQFARKNMLSPLMAHVLKFGMPLEDVSFLLGPPDEERRGAHSEIGAPSMVLVYRIEQENAEFETLILEFSSTMRLTDFYILGRARPLIY